jgi:DNA polymerase III alpha subunit
MTVEEFDRQNQGQWNMPREYIELDIAKWLLDRCNTDAERQRVGEELLLYLDRDMFPLLQYLKYLVDTMRKYNIVWGVGRGSSVSSYVLYLIGIHKIDSIYYGLDIQEFLR